MKRVISLSALVSGLLATSGYAAPTMGVVRRADEGAIIAAQEPVSAEAAAKLQAELIEMIEKGPADVGGMQALQRAVAAEMREHMKNVLAAGVEQPAAEMEKIQGDFAPVRSQQPPLWAIEEIAKPLQAQIEFQQELPTGVVNFQRTEKGTFLGVTTSRVAGALREQLGLTKGFGLVVDFVAKDSPAEAAGLKMHDVLTKLDDQLLVNTEQLAVLVRAKKAGDEVTLTAIRGGKETKLTAKLVERDIPVDPLPEGWHGMIEREMPGRRFDIHEPPAAMGGWQMRGHVTVSAPGDGSTHGTYKDAEHDITLTREKDGKTTVIARDRTGKELYNGPYSTAEEKEKVPAELRAKIDRLENHEGVRAADTVAGAEAVTFRRVDDDHDIEMRINKGVKSVTVKEVKSGKTVYDGPGEGEEELAKMPAGVAEKVKSMKAKVDVKK